jgi:hypothetical protein
MTLKETLDVSVSHLENAVIAGLGAALVLGSADHVRVRG